MDTALKKAILAIGNDNGVTQIVRTQDAARRSVEKCVAGLREHFGKEEYEKVCAIAGGVLALVGEAHFRDLVCTPDLWWEQGNPAGRPEWPMDEYEGAPPGLNKAADDLFTTVPWEERDLFQKFLSESFDSEHGLDLFSVARGTKGSPTPTSTVDLLINIPVGGQAVLHRLIKTVFFSARGVAPADVHVAKCIHRLVSDFPTEGDGATIEKIIGDYLPFLWDSCLGEQEVFAQVLDCTDIWSGVVTDVDGWATDAKMPHVSASARRTIDLLMEIIKPEVLQAMGNLVVAVWGGQDSIFAIVDGE